MASARTLELELEVPGEPEQVWEAIASGPGIAAWFVPAEVEGGVGGTITHHHGTDAITRAAITEWEAPRRLAYEEEGWVEGGPPMTTVFEVDGRPGGTSVVRLRMRGFGSGFEWDGPVESLRTGWLSALRQLQLYLAHFPGLAPSTIVVAGAAARPLSRGWRELTEALGLPYGATDGERLETGPGAPRLAGRVERSAEGLLSLLISEPAPGIGFIGAGGPGDEVFTFVRLHLFGEGAAAAAAREAPEWQRWMAEHFPAPAA